MTIELFYSCLVEHIYELERVNHSNDWVSVSM